MAHDEFPELTHQAKCVLMNTLNGIDVSRHYWDRRFAAAVIRQVMRQAGTFTVGTGLEGEVVEVVTLNCIADNLHALPPPPPTREEMEIALADLLRRTDDPAGCREDSPIAEFANILRRGIAHYCKVQP
jgi:hypothetical protein